VDFQGTPYTITVKPSKRPDRNVRRVIEKKASLEALTGAESAALSHHQDSRGKKLVRLLNLVILCCSDLWLSSLHVFLFPFKILKCGICQKETEAVLRKLKEDPRAKSESVTTDFVDNKGFTSRKDSSALPLVSASKAIPQFKKKKKKDQFAGLKKTAVMSLKSKKKFK